MFLKLDIFHLIFSGIPEIIAMVLIFYAINKYEFNWKKILLISILQALTIFVFRHLPITYGGHPIVALFTFSVYIQIFNKGNFIKTIAIAALIIVYIALLEIIIISPMLKLFQITIEEANSNNLLWLLLTWPQVIVMFITAFLINIFQRKKNISVEGR